MSKKILGLLLLSLMPQVTLGNERHFVFSYESPVLKEGVREFESYTTYRFGRDTFYSGLRENLEFEVGLGSGIQTSLYLNFDQALEDDGSGTGTINESLLFDGAAVELKAKILDNVADPVGLGLYLESEFEPDELDLETKIIVDKKEGDILWTLNLTVEPHFDLVANGYALTLTPSAGFGLFIVPGRFFLGLEAQNENEFAGSPLIQISSILSAGPVLSFTGGNWWTTLTLLPQVANLMGGPLDLVNGQRWQIRLANSWEL